MVDALSETRIAWFISLELLRRQPPAISEPFLAELRGKLNQPQGFKNYGEVQQWLKEEYGLEIHYKTVYQTVHYKLKAKLKVARPTHIKRDDTAVVEFKKNSRPNLS